MEKLRLDIWATAPSASWKKTVNYDRLLCFGERQPGSSWHQKTRFLSKGTKDRNKLILGTLKGVEVEEGGCQQYHVFKVVFVAPMGVPKA